MFSSLILHFLEQRQSGGQPRSRYFSHRDWEGRKKTLASRSASHVVIKQSKIISVINYDITTLISEQDGGIARFCFCFFVMRRLSIRQFNH